jgi:hypothetical protein
MTGKIVNLTRARKTRARDTERKAADANAARFGRTKAEREIEARRAEQADRHLDQHRLADEPE